MNMKNFPAMVAYTALTENSGKCLERDKTPKRKKTFYEICEIVSVRLIMKEQGGD